MNSRLVIISKRYQLMLVTKNKYIWYCNGNVYMSSTEERTDIRFVKKIYQPGNTVKSRIKNVLIHSRMFQRVLRLQPRAIAYSEEGMLCFAYDRKIFLWNMQNDSWKSFDIRPEMRNPLCIAYVSGVEGFRDSFIYGEYGWNDERGEVRILQLNGDEWETVFAFPRNTICHVHSLIPDRENACVYIMTGDRDSESGIWKATDNFKKIEPYAVGSQQYRSCAGVLQSDRILFATDTPIEKNYLYEVGENAQLARIAELPGPVINHMVINTDWWLATTVEQDPNLPHLQHCISCRKAPGIKDRYVHIFCKKKMGELVEIAALQKDALPMWLFQFGNVAFVENHRDDRVFAIPMAVGRYSQRTIEIVVEG